MELQLIAQTELTNVVWETNNPQLERRYLIANKANSHL